MPWNPSIGYAVDSLAISGTTIYAGGNFTSVGCASGCSITPVQSRSYAVAIGTDGSLQSWNPRPSDTVVAIATSSSGVYLAGSFRSVNSVSRNFVAALGTDGMLLNWNPNANGTVNTLAISDGQVYAGGSFTQMGGVARNRLAAIGSDGSTLSWNPNSNNTVNALAANGSTIYVGGNFTTIGCASGCSITPVQTRNRLAAIDTNGSLQAWDPRANSNVLSIVISGSTIYTGGAFTQIGCASGCSITPA